MKKQAFKITIALSLLTFLTAIVLFGNSSHKNGGIMLTLFWLLLSVSFMQATVLKKFAYTAIILGGVTVALTFPEYFVSLGSFELKKLIVPLLQIITFGVGCTMSPHDLSGILKMPKAVFVGVLCHYTIMPFVGFTIAKVFGFPAEIAAGVVWWVVCQVVWQVT